MLLHVLDKDSFNPPDVDTRFELNYPGPLRSVEDVVGCAIQPSVHIADADPAFVDITRARDAIQLNIDFALLK